MHHIALVYTGHIGNTLFRIHGLHFLKKGPKLRGINKVASSTISAFVFLTACATLPPQYANAPKSYALNPEAAGVKIVEFVPTAQRDHLEEIEMVSCALGMNMVNVESNIESCNNKLKNDAHALGSNWTAGV